MKFLLILSLIFSMGAMAETKKPKAEPTQIDDLIRGELAAMKTYDTVIKDLKGAEKTQMESIRRDHEKNVDRLSKYVSGKPELLDDTESSGVWGTFSTAWTKGAKLFGNETALKALQQGEEHGVNEYMEALDDDSIPKELKSQIREDMIPKQRAHIQTLKTFL